MENIYFPVIKCCNCGESFIINKAVDKNYISIKKGISFEYGKIHNCKENLPVNFDEYKNKKFYLKYDIIGYILNGESEDEENEIRNGSINNRNQENNRETNIDK